MFRQRLLTALILVPLVLFAIYYAPLWVLGLSVVFLVLIGGWEWLQLIPITHVAGKWIFMLALVIAIWLSMYCFQYWLIVGLLAWIVILLAVLGFPASQVFWGYPVIVGGFCLLLLPLFVSVLAAISQAPQGKDLIVYALFLVWAADIGAYLAGKAWGRYKLIPQVSPGKTIEGTIGGFILAMLVSLLSYFYFTPVSLLSWVLTAACTALISVLGDLFISILKRRCRLKDTGHIFPGHGGMLDRLDSLIAAFPLFYLCLRFMLPGF